MNHPVRKLGKAGFTLIEILVALILLALTVAAVFPVVTQQADNGDPTRVAGDLATIRTAVETFHLNVRPQYPADLEDLANPITTGEDALDGDEYSTPATTAWNGPYIDAALAAGSAAQESGDAFATGFGANVQNDLVCISTGVTTGTCANNSYIAVQVEDLDADQFALVNRLVDGASEASPTTNGKFRFDTTSEIAYYVVGTYRGN